MRCIKLLLFGVSVSLLLAGSVHASDDPAPSEEDETPPTVEELDQKVRTLERLAEIAREAEAEKAKAAVSATAGKDGFTLKSADGANVVKIRGYVQADGRFFNYGGERPGVDTFLMRRARPIVEGTVLGRFDFRIMPDFGGGATVLQDAYVDARLVPAFRVRAGKFKAPFGLERLQSATDILFVERALPTNLVPNRDVGVQLHGDLERASLSWALGVFNGVVDGGSADADTNDQKDVVARIFLRPVPALGIGIAASQGDASGTAAAPGLPTYRTQAQQSFFSYRSDATVPGTVVAAGDRKRLAPQANLYLGRFGAQAEYVISSQEVALDTTTADLEHDAWQVSASFALTDDKPTYRAISPRKDFSPENDTWGAWEIKARYAELDIDDATFPNFANPATQATRAKAMGAGVNWYLNRNVRVSLDYETTRFEGGAAVGDRADEDVIFTRFQVSF